MLLGLRPEWNVPDRHMCPASPMSADRTLHLYYSMLNLQKEIEKRTYYLGSKRAGVNEQAPHLLDLIGMSRDEKDLLYSFAKAAMADVYDALSQSTTGLPKQYKWEDKPNVVTIKRRKRISDYGGYPGTFSNIEFDAQQDAIRITGKVDIYGQDMDEWTGDALETDWVNDIIRPNVLITINYKTRRTIIATGEVESREYNVPIMIDKNGVGKATGDSAHMILNFTYYHPFHLHKQNGVYTAEQLEGSITTTAITLANDWEYVNPQAVVAGEHFKISNSLVPATEYNALREFTENDLVADDAERINLSGYADVVEQGEIIEEGIHYYIGFPNYFEESLIEPLDNAILEALVNRIIWKWLCISYPNEAQAYDTFYQQSIAALKTRTDIFKKHWVERTPRIY